MSVITQPGQGCGHELKPGAQFCTVCGARPAPSGVQQESSLPAYPPGQGCGHELKPGAQFCTVCGARPADGGQRTALVTGEQAPAQPEPVNPASSATVTSWPSAKPSDDGVGSGPRRGRPGPAAAPGDTTPRQDRWHRSRWPLVIGVVALLAAGGAAAAFIVQPSHHSQAAAGTLGTSSAVPRQSLSASAAATPSSAVATPSSAAATPSSATATATPSPLSAQQAAASLAGLLTQSVSDRSSTVNAVNSISACGPTLSQGPQVLDSAAAARQRLLAQLASLPGRSALSGQMLQALTGAWQASATADQDFARWAQDELSRGCTQNDQADPNLQAARAPDDQATTYKKAFVKLWNPIAAQYGLTPYTWNQL